MLKIHLLLCGLAVAAVRPALAADEDGSIVSEEIVVRGAQVSLIEEVSIPARQTGVIQEVGVKAGMTVEPGAAIASFDYFVPMLSVT